MKKDGVRSIKRKKKQLRKVDEEKERVCGEKVEGDVEAK